MWWQNKKKIEEIPEIKKDLKLDYCLLKLEKLLQKFDPEIKFYPNKTTWTELLKMVLKIRTQMTLEDKVELNWYVNILSLRWSFLITTKDYCEFLEALKDFE